MTVTAAKSSGRCVAVSGCSDIESDQNNNTTTPDATTRASANTRMTPRTRTEQQQQQHQHQQHQHQNQQQPDLSEGAADLPEVILRDVLVEVADVQLQPCQGSGVAENYIGLSGRVLGLLLLRSEERFSAPRRHVLVAILYI